MKLPTIIVYSYGVLMLLGGIMGYVMGKSSASLAAGLGSAVLLAAAGSAIGQGKSWGVPLASGVMILLMIFFASRYMETHNFMRSGMLALLSLVALIALLITSRSPS